jgi:acyl-CoA reductase-like NAD-dependent aldehyde dehydrogenase
MAQKSAPVYQNYINGEFVPAKTGRSFENRNPADWSRPLRRTAGRGRLDAAAEAYKTWRLMPGPARGEILYRAGEILRDRKEQYARDMTREMGKVLKETKGDVQEAIDMAFLMAGEGRRLHGQTTPSELPSKFAMSIRAPMGVCGFITPWNFPMAIPAWKSTAALICGNTIVIKPATDTPEALGTREKGVFNTSRAAAGRHAAHQDPRRVISPRAPRRSGRSTLRPISSTCTSRWAARTRSRDGRRRPRAAADGSVPRSAWASAAAASRILVHKKVYRSSSRLVEKTRTSSATASGRDRQGGRSARPARHRARLHRHQQGRGAKLAAGSNLAGKRTRRAIHRALRVRRLQPQITRRDRGDFGP